MSLKTPMSWPSKEQWAMSGSPSVQSVLINLNTIKLPAVHHSFGHFVWPYFEASQWAGTMDNFENRVICVLVCTGWGKIPSLLSVGHCEGRGGHRRVGLGLKGTGSREVPVTTLPSRKDSVVEQAACICRRNILFEKSLYRSGAARVPYSLPNPPSGLSTGPKIHSVVG